MTAGVTIQQGRCLDYIRQYATDHGCSPSYDEIKVAVGIASRGGVNRLLNQLQDRGAVAFTNRSRSIRIIEGPTRAQMLEWSEEEFARIVSDIRSIIYQRQIAAGVARADAIQSGAR